MGINEWGQANADGAPGGTTDHTDVRMTMAMLSR